MKILILAISLASSIAMATPAQDIDKVLKKAGYTVVDCYLDLGFQDYLSNCATFNRAKGHSTDKEILNRLVKSAQSYGWKLIKRDSESSNSIFQKGKDVFKMDLMTSSASLQGAVIVYRK